MATQPDFSATGRRERGILSYGDRFIFTLFTNDRDLAQRADRAGINRVGLDLEKIGKDQRQSQTPGWISDHSVAELAVIGDVLKTAKLFIRTNPIHSGSPAEIDEYLEAGAQVLMLPYFRTCADAEQFVRLIDGRAEVSLLLETASAMARVHDIVRISGIDEIHVGLNDLHLDLKLDNHFQVLCSPIIDMLADTIGGAGIAFGFGGVARRGDTSLPIDPDMVYSQYPRLRADRALITRAYVTPDYRRLDLDAELRATRAALDEWSGKPVEELETAREWLRQQVGRWQIG